MFRHGKVRPAINEGKQTLSCGKVLLGQHLTQTFEYPSKATKQQNKYTQNATLII